MVRHVFSSRAKSEFWCHVNKRNIISPVQLMEDEVFLASFLWTNSRLECLLQTLQSLFVPSEVTERGHMI